MAAISGFPNILRLAAHQASLDIFFQAGQESQIAAQKSEKTLTGYLDT